MKGLKIEGLNTLFLCQKLKTEFYLRFFKIWQLFFTIGSSYIQFNVRYGLNIVQID